ncbi:LOW QUALITY PROTEIN: glycine N-acyltransferase-like protein Keg1 [Malaclemys terrapin pileata]|uniref:LOW QUALITY PROTEIN: glycine N-acyltransferase-like protein Keg1 n=1 Tax=Malaclemys terrapin pileata TaxID=2991368 RepID=UPI0023A82E7B|nr:LOW QUALITY PROTEIN: glycine N-acyltransferase-like protein Keg1 [Malaclemys terrapin pileata]
MPEESVSSGASGEDSGVVGEEPLDSLTCPAAGATQLTAAEPVEATASASRPGPELPRDDPQGAAFVFPSPDPIGAAILPPPPPPIEPGSEADNVAPVHRAPRRGSAPCLPVSVGHGAVPGAPTGDDQKPVTPPPHTLLDPAVRLSSLDVSHVDLLNECSNWGGNEKIRKYLATLIQDIPSVCLLDAAGHLVSWIASYPFGATGLGYTLPQHQWRGYMGMLNNLIAKRLHALGYPSYSYVAAENNPMQRLQERQGFQRQPTLCYFILHNPALAKAPTLTTSPAPGTAPA